MKIFFYVPIGKIDYYIAEYDEQQAIEHQRNEGLNSGIIYRTDEVALKDFIDWHEAWVEGD